MITVKDAFAPLRADEMLDKRYEDRDRDEWKPILPVPADAPELTDTLLQRFAPPGYSLSAVWRYPDAEGRLHGLIVRYDRPANGWPADKQFRPLTFGEGPNGQRKWRVKAFPAPRPLYGLDKLVERSDAPVLVVEGEKSADAAAKRFPDMVVVTSFGGSNAACKADWSALAGRDVIIWPDADEPGMSYAKDAAEALRRAGAACVRVVKLPATFPLKWDLADPLPSGVTDNQIVKLLSEAKAAQDQIVWPKPLPIPSTLPPVEPFGPELLPVALRDFALDVADRQQSAPDFIAVAAVCAISAVVGNKVRIRPKQHDNWEVVPNLWGAIVGRPSAMKSPAMKAALAPLNTLEKELRKSWEEECRELALEAEFAELGSKDAKKRANQAFRDGDQERAKEILRGDKAEGAESRPCPRLVVNDATVEKLGELLNENPSGLLLVRDELPGFLARMESEEHQGERAFYLEAFNGDGQFTYDRIGRGTVQIANCTLSLIGGVQPSRIAPLVRGALSGERNDGLIQRLQMTVWPDDVGSWTWVDRLPDFLAHKVYEDAVRRLHAIPPVGDGKPQSLRFTEPAQAMFREWMEEIQAEARSGKLSSTLESHILKMPKTVASLALIFELIDSHDMPQSIGQEATARALDWADYLRSHAGRLYAAGQMMVEDGAKLITERRHQLPELFTARDVQRKGWSMLTDRDAVQSAIEMLIATHHCRELPTPSTPAGGRPSTAYVWNPALKAGG